MDWHPSNWVKNYKHEYTYDSYGNKTLDVYYLWDSTTSTFVNREKYEYTYDSHGNQILRVDYLWDSTTNTWNSGFRDKYECTYDSYGNRTLDIYFNWNSTTNNWENSKKWENTYDSYGNKTFLVNYNWDSATNNWIISGTKHYYYSKTKSSAVQSVSDKKWSLYPNPTTDYIKMNGFEGIALIVIRNINGKAILTKQINGNEKINVSSLSKGIYIVTVTTSEGTLERKIVKN